MDDLTAFDICIISDMWIPIELEKRSTQENMHNQHFFFGENNWNWIIDLSFHNHDK